MLLLILIFFFSGAYHYFSLKLFLTFLKDKKFLTMFFDQKFNSVLYSVLVVGIINVLFFETKKIRSKRTNATLAGVFSLLCSYWGFSGLRINSWLTLHHKKIKPGGIILGGSGSGKTSSLLIPSILKCSWPGSIFVTDPKGEIYKNCFLSLKKAGFNVIRLAPFDSLSKIKFNPFKFSMDDAYVNRIAQFIIQNGLHAQGQKHDVWNQGAAELLAGAFIWGLHHNMDFIQIVDFIRLSKEEELINSLTSLEKTKTNISGIAGSKGTSMSANLRSNLNIALHTFNLQTLRNFLIEDPGDTIFDPHSFIKEKTAIFLEISLSNLKLMEHISALIIDQLFDVCLQQTGERRESLFLLEEAGNIGKILDLPEKTSLMREYGVSIWPILQSYSQFLELYGQTGWATIKTNLAFKILFKGVDLPTAEEISRILGNRVEEAESLSKSQERLSKSFHAEEIPLLRPDEIINLPKNKILFFEHGGKAGILSQSRYYRDPFMLFKSWKSRRYLKNKSDEQKTEDQRKPSRPEKKINWLGVA